MHESTLICDRNLKYASSESWTPVPVSHTTDRWLTLLERFSYFRKSFWINQLRVKIKRQPCKEIMLLLIEAFIWLVKFPSRKREGANRKRAWIIHENEKSYDNWPTVNMRMRDWPWVFDDETNAMTDWINMLFLVVDEVIYTL